MLFKKIFFTLLTIIISLPSWAQSDATGNQTSSSETLIYIIIGLVLLISVLVLLVSIYTLYVVRTILRDERSKTEEGIEEELESQSLWKKISKELTKAKPVEEEEDILLDHDYDGIKELDNHLPPWWKWLFYLTIVWSIGYLLVYHVFNWLPLSAESYQTSIVKAEAAMEAQQAGTETASIDENNVTITTNETDLAAGETIFKRQCAVCHAQDGGGGVGPNMTDNYWIHGGDIKDLFHTIKYGVPEKGMISWESQLNPTDMRNVASYILEELVGTEPANPKAPQGELYTPEENQEENVEQDTTKTDSNDVAMM